MLVPPPVPWLVASGKFYRPLMTILCIFMGFTSRSFADIVLYFMDIKADVAREIKEFALHSSSLPKLVLPASLISKLSPVAAAVLSPRGAASPKQQKQLSPKATTTTTSTTAAVPVPAEMMVVAKSMTPLRASTPPPPRAPTPKAPTPKAPTPKAPTPKAPTPQAPTPKVPRALTPPSRAATPPAKVTTPKELTPVRGDTGLSGSYWLNPAARRATPGGTVSGAGATPGRAVSAARATSIGRAISAGRSGLLDRPTVSSALKRREASPAAARRRR